MNYYYNFKANFCEENIYNFYEWENNDELTFIKKVPVYKISTSLLHNLLIYKVQIDDEFLEEIKNKTICDAEERLNLALFTDQRNSILIEFDDYGKSIYYSNLSLKDELDLLELSYCLKRVNFNIKKISHISQGIELRQLRKIQKIINIELKQALDSNHAKLKYLYQEIFEQEEKNIKKCYEELNEAIKKDLNKSLQLYNVIKLTYKKLSH